MKKNFKESKVVIMGCGRLGASLANYLYDKGHEVIIVDKNEDAFRKLSGSYGGLAYVSDCCEIDIFKKTEMDEDTVLIVVTNDDNTNIMISQMARKTCHVKNIICRLYDPDRECVYDEFNIDTICPTYLSKVRIEQILSVKGVDIA